MAISHGALNVVDYSTLTVSTTAVSLADTSPAMDLDKKTVGGKSVRRALITVEDNSGCRWRADGTDPTASEGHELGDTDILTLIEANYEELLRTIRFYTVSGDSKLKITFFD